MRREDITHEYARAPPQVKLRDWAPLDGAALDRTDSGNACRAMAVVHSHGSRGTAAHAEVVHEDAKVVHGDAEAAHGRSRVLRCTGDQTSQHIRCGWAAGKLTCPARPGVLTSPKYSDILEDSRSARLYSARRSATPHDRLCVLPQHHTGPRTPGGSTLGWMRHRTHGWKPQNVRGGSKPQTVSTPEMEVEVAVG